MSQVSEKLCPISQKVFFLDAQKHTPSASKNRRDGGSSAARILNIGSGDAVTAPVRLLGWHVSSLSGGDSTQVSREGFRKSFLEGLLGEV